MKTFAKTTCEDFLGYELPDLKNVFFFNDLKVCEDFRGEVVKTFVKTLAKTTCEDFCEDSL